LAVFFLATFLAGAFLATFFFAAFFLAMVKISVKKLPEGLETLRAVEISSRRPFLVVVDAMERLC
jgi:hypothetical protein